jgi:post-segregation antitoxin (ccd killing protein)
MRMARVNVYLPDDLADAVRQADLNVSAIAQEALMSALEVQASTRWLDEVSALAPSGVGHEEALDAVSAARDELGT